MTITYHAGRRIQGESDSVTLTQSTGGTSSAAIYFVTSSWQRTFLGQEFNTGHTLIGKTITSVTLTMEHNNPNAVYKLVKLSSTNVKTDLEDVDMTWVASNGGLATYKFESFTSFTLSAGDKIGIYADGVSGSNSGNWIKVEISSSDVESNANLYQIHDTDTGDVTVDLKYTIEDAGDTKPINTYTTEIYNKSTGAASLDLYTAIPRVGIKAVSGNTTGHINKIKVFLRVIGTHTSTNAVYVRVRKISDDSIVATATKTIADLTSGTTVTEYEFDFGSCVEITEAEHYVLVEYAYGDASNYLGVSRHESAVTGWEWLQYSNGAYSSSNSSQGLRGSFSSQVGHVCTSTQVGSRFEETDTRKMYHYADLTYGGFPKFWAEEGVAIGTYPPTRGVWASGYTNTPSNQALNTIDYVTIASHTGTATDFGDMTGSRASSSGASSYTRGVIAGGSSSIANIEFITIMTKSNASNFGDLTVARENVATVTDRSRGMWIAGGDSGSTVIDYVTISTLADATSFGTLSTARRLAQGVNDATIGLVAGGYISSAVSSVLKFTIQTLGNGTSFGSLSSDRYNVATVSSQTRGIWAGGQAGVNTDMDYRTIAGTSATATVFGSLGTAQTGANGNSDLTRGVIAGGWVTSLMQVMTIDTGSGGATTYGNLSLARDHPAGALEG